MTLREVLDLAKITVLGSYAMKDDENAIITILNFALTQVYREIPVLQEMQVLQMVKNKTMYNYNTKAYKIISATSDCNVPIAINDDLDPYSITDLGNTVLDIPLCLQETTNAIALNLHIKPPTITCDNIDTVDFLPDDAVISATLSYMAYMVSKNISEQMGTIHYQEYRREIDDVKFSGAYNTYNHSRAYATSRNGWV